MLGGAEMLGGAMLGGAEMLLARMLNTRGVSSFNDLINKIITRYTYVYHIKRVFYCFLFTNPLYLAS